LCWLEGERGALPPAGTHALGARGALGGGRRFLGEEARGACLGGDQAGADALLPDIVGRAG